MNAQFEQGLREITQSSTALTSEIADYILQSGGKRLRPRLVMIIAEAIGLASEAALPMAYAVELMHTASLLHDDVIDGTEMRRAKPTANQVFGNRAALLGGDYILAAALGLICEQQRGELTSFTVDTIKKMTEGELKELEYSRAFHSRMEDYLDVIYLKTATLFEFCTYAPGVVADLEADKLDALVTYGRNMGMAFQIVDDIINLAPVSGDNKDAFNDILEGKSTMPLILLFEDQPELIDRLGELDDPAAWRELVMEHMQSAYLEESARRAKAYCDEGCALLEQTGFLTDELRAIPQLVMQQVRGRV